MEQCQAWNHRCAAGDNYLNKTFPDFGIADNRVEMASLFGIVFIMGILITWASTFMATQRFLNLRTDELYY